MAVVRMRGRNYAGNLLEKTLNKSTKNMKTYENRKASCVPGSLENKSAQCTHLTLELLQGGQLAYHRTRKNNKSGMSSYIACVGHASFPQVLQLN